MAKKSVKTSEKSALGKINKSEAKELLQDLRTMLLIRRFEEKAGQLYGMGLIGGFCHLYIGQEAVVVGIQSSLQPQDCVITGYRDHGHMLACGMEANGVMAELTGREGGYSRGKGGSMHMFSREKNFYGGHGIVGAQVPLGAGLAFALKYKGIKGVTTAYMGDGAVNQGQVYESFNMAALWQLPVIFVIENNQYGMGTSTSRAAAGSDTLFKRGEAYGIKGYRIDGMDIRAVKSEIAPLVEKCRKGGGPVIVEVMTYRYRGHSMSDPAKYRSKEEVQEVRQKHDPITSCKEALEAGKYLSEDDFKAMDKEVKAIVSSAAEFAQSSPLPAESELWTDVLLPV